ncbi:MAG: hypothetical protein SNJ78_02120 [Spirochaetales bacterium]
MPIDVALNGEKFAQLDTLISEEGEIYLSYSQLKTMLKGRVLPEVWERMGESPRPGWMQLTGLTSLGIEASFDRQLLALNIVIPAHLRPYSKVMLSGISPTYGPLTDAPTPFSAYINTSSSLSLLYESYAEKTTSFPLSLSLMPVFNYKGWVVEAGVSAQTHPEKDISFEYERLVRDLEPHFLRITLGTLGVSVQGFQSAYILEGFSLVRDPMVFRKERVLSEEVLFLERPGIVRVYVNDQLIRTIPLEPGTHQLMNFPYVSGVNEVRIQIQEEDLPERTIQRYVSFEGRMQPVGEYTYVIKGGIPRWYPDLPVVQGSILLGLMPWLTGGLNLQGNPNRQLIGIETLFALPLGILMSDFALAFREYEMQDWAASLRYRFSFPGRKQFPMVGWGVQYRGSKFHPPADPLEAEEPPAWEISGMIAQPLPFGLNLGLSASYQIARFGKDQFVTSLTAFQTIRKGANLVISLSMNRVESGAFETRGSIAVTLSSPENRSTTTFTSYPWEEQASTSVQVRPEVPEGSLVIDTTLEGFPLEEERPAAARISGSYGTRFFETILIQNVFKGSSEYLGSRTIAQLRSALVYAEGVWGFSKPVFDSFAMVVPTAGLAQESIWVSSSVGGELKATQKTPGMFLLNSYEPVRLLIDAPEAPPGYEVGEGVRVIRPSYRSGTVIQAGTLPTRFIEGKLIRGDGTPVAFQVGKLRLITRYGEGGEAKEEFTFFTDEEGVFQVYKLIPGEYEIYLSDRFKPLRITLPVEREGFLSLGTLALSEQ